MKRVLAQQLPEFYHTDLTFQTLATLGGLTSTRSGPFQVISTSFRNQTVIKARWFLTGSSGWSDYAISADAIVTSSSGVVGLLAWATHLDNAPKGITRYTTAIDSNRGDFTLYKGGDKGATTLSSKPVPGGIQASQKYHLSLSVKSTTRFATVTGSGGAKTNLSVTDNGLGRGMAGLFGSYGSGGFSNVQIQSEA